MAIAQTNQTWYDTYMKMKKKESQFEKYSPNAVVDKQDADDIDEMMHAFDAPELRSRLFGMQQELCVYHDMLDELEQLKAHNEELERQSAELLEEHSSHKKKLKDDARNTLRSLDNEVAQLKAELVQSKAKEYSHNFKIQTVISEKLALEETAKSLRERVRTCAGEEINRDPIGDEFQKHNIQTIGSEKQVSRRSSLLLSLYTEAMRDCRQKLEMEVTNAERRKPTAASSA
uniref:Uncharacterized protein n=1 Tax=Ditylum brightwellii TaxID=49249 RepID=A0A7S4QUS8_9STRA